MARLSLSLIILSVCLTASLVHLIVPPKTPVLSRFQPAALGTNRELFCDAYQAGAGAINYFWYRYKPPDSAGNTWEITGNIGAGQTITLKPVYDMYSGKYKCRASNSAGTRDSDWEDLYVYTTCSQYTVSVSPPIFAVGSTFTVNCYIPNPSGFAVYWTRQPDTSSPVLDAGVANSKGCHAPNNTRYSWSSCSPPSLSSKTNTFNLQITNAQTTDFAYLRCKDTGLNCTSDPVKPVVLAQNGIPQITGFPTEPVVVGAKVNLKCVASPSGDTYDWYKDGKKLTISLSYDLHVKKESAGVYKCVARNATGSATSSEKTLIVYYKADSVVVSSAKGSCHTGEADRFTCTATGGFPSPSLSIYMKRVEGSGTSPFRIYKDREMEKLDNQAEYYCVANVHGYPALVMTSTRTYKYSVTFPNTKIFFINNPTAVVLVGQVMKFTCATDESNPVTSTKWYQSVGGSFQAVNSGITSSEKNGTYGGKILISEWSVTAAKDMNGGTVRCTSYYSLTGHGLIVSADTYMSVKGSATELNMVEKPNSPITAGTSVNIKCETASITIGSPGISWYRNGQQITTGVTQSTKSATDGGTVYVSQLTVTARKEDNQAKYECKINNQAKFKKDVTITVHWSAIELRIVEKPNFPITAGTSVNIKCETDSSNSGSPGTISWYRNGQQITAGVSPSARSATGAGTIYTSQLTVTAWKEDNKAKYECKINDQANFKKAVTITVHWSATELKMVEKPNSPIKAGTRVNIKCETDSSNTGVPGTISWYRKGQQITTGVTPSTRSATDGGTIYISQLTVTARKEDNQAKYECKINDQVNFRKAVTITVNWSATELKMVEKPNSPITAGTRVNIKCETDSSNTRVPGTISWYRKGQQITTGVTPSTRSATDGGTIYISQLTVTARKDDNQAKYECKINDQPKFKKDVTFTVHWSATELKMVEKPNSPIKEGTIVNIKCETDSSNSGSPGTISWYRNGQQITTGVTTSTRSATDGGTTYISQLTVKTRKEDNPAKYECKINDQAKFKKDVTITVHWSATELKMVEKPNSIIRAGTNVNIKCETDSIRSRSPGISWYRNGQQITTGITQSTRSATDGGTIYISQLTVTTRKEDNQANYECKMNAQANFKNDVTITVHWSVTELTMVEKPSSPITAGTRVNIKCETDSSNSGSPGTISWYRNGQQITTGITSSTRSATDGGTIYISQLTVTARKDDNQAKYECNINDQAKFKKDVTIIIHSSATELKMVEKPNFPITVGTSVNIKCETSSSKAGSPGISWYRNGQQITTGVTPSTRSATDGGTIYISQLTVTTMKQDNQAKYECKINDRPTLKKDVTITVRFNPSQIAMIQKPETVINEGQLITIVCETDSANPAADIQFHKKRPGGGRLLELTSGITSDDRDAPQYNGKIRKGRLTVTSNRLDNQAVFGCKVKEGTFQVDQNTTVTVYYPPIVQLSSSPKTVKEGDDLTLTCQASGGNPTTYTYSWYYKNGIQRRETSREYRIASIKYTQSGVYWCKAVNYSPGGTADSTSIDVLYKAKWNPASPKLFTVGSKTNEPVKFVLHVVANPLPTNVTWFYQNNTAIGKEFSAQKMNDTTYTLNKSSVNIKDYGNYKVNVSNQVGVSTFVFELLIAGPPYPPCCLKVVKTTAVSILVAFKSNFSGGSQQTFTIEQRSSVANGGNAWVIASKQIPDPAFRKDVLQKIRGLTGGITYEFRVKAENADGSSGYGNILTTETAAAPRTVLEMNRDGKLVIASWTPLGRRYTKIDVKYCTTKGFCKVLSVKDPTDVEVRFSLDDEESYEFNLRVFDGEDIVFISPPVRPPPPVQVAPASGNFGMIAGVTASVVVLVAIIVVLIVVMQRLEKCCFSGDTTVTFDNNTGDMLDAEPDYGPVYMNIENRAFRADDPREAEPEYDEPEPEIVYAEVRPDPVEQTAHREIGDLTVAEFKYWLLSKQVTESTYKVLAKNGFNKAAIFILIEREDIKGLHIKPLGQAVLIRNLVNSFNMINAGEGRQEAGAFSRDRGARDDMDNPYAELNIRPFVRDY